MDDKDDDEVERLFIRLCGDELYVTDDTMCGCGSIAACHSFNGRIIVILSSSESSRRKPFPRNIYSHLPFSLIVTFTFNCCILFILSHSLGFSIASSAFQTYVQIFLVYIISLVNL